MWARIPILGWAMAFILNLFMAVPTYFLWNYIAPKYLSFIPLVYQTIPFFDIIWIIMLVSIVKVVFLKGIFTASIEQKQSK